METVRSLPPELQALIDEYNKLMEEGGYNKPYVEGAFLDTSDDIQYSSSDDADETNTKGGFSGTAYVPSDLTYDEWKARDKRIKELNNEVFYLARKLINEGKIEAIPNESIKKSDTYVYNKVRDSNTGQIVYTSTHSPALTKYKSTSGSEALEPMRPIKAGLDQKERLSKELQQSTPIDMPRIEKELIMRANPGMRTGQEPGYYVIKDEGKRNRVRPVENEELQYYRTQNRIQR